MFLSNTSLSNVSQNMSNKTDRREDEVKKENKDEKKPSRITVSDVGLVMSIISLLFVLSGMFLK